METLETPDLVQEMQGYYRQRATVYDRSMGYDQPETVARQQSVIDFLYHTLAGRQVLEIACGPGFWTQYVAASASRITATDFNPETLAEAAKKGLDPLKVTFQFADAYALPFPQHSFNASLAADWFCHVPRSRRFAFLAGLQKCLEPGAIVILCDQLPAPEKQTGNHDAEGNHLQERHLEGGSRFTVIKNYPTESEMREVLAPFAEEIDYRIFPEARRWAVAYISKTLRILDRSAALPLP